MKTHTLGDNIFGIRLQQLRKARGLSMTAMCEALNRNKNASISKSSISMWENGQREPFAGTIKMLADFFSVSPAYLMGMTDDMNQTEEPIPEFVKDDYIDSLVEAFGKLSIPSRIKLLSFAWDLLDKEGKA